VRFEYLGDLRSIDHYAKRLLPRLSNVAALAQLSANRRGAEAHAGVMQVRGGSRHTGPIVRRF
jgi:hypothetical protein